MSYRHFFVIICMIFMVSGCQKAEEQQRFIMPDIVVAVAPFTQPTQTTELLAGFIPEAQKRIPESTLNELTDLFHKKLHAEKHSYVFLSNADIQGDMARDERGRRNALITWAERAKKAGADMIIVPHAVVLQERVGSKLGVVTPAAINEDFYLIDAREPVTLVTRCHFSEEQKSLASDITRIGSFFKRGGWITAQELAAEGMDKAVREFGL